jgi:opacity protein-like surface antigen
MAMPLMVRRAFFCVLLVCVFSMYVHGQDRLEHITFDVGGGFSFPTGQLGNRVQTGFSLVASGGPRFNPRFSVGLDFAIHYFNLNNFLGTPVNQVNSLGSMVRMWSLTVNPTYQFWKEENVSSYVTGGYGIYNRDLQLPTASGVLAVGACDAFWNVCAVNSQASAISDDLNTYKGGFNVGGGVNFGSHTKFFVEARYHHMFTTHSPTELIPLTVGVRW